MDRVTRFSQRHPAHQALRRRLVAARSSTSSAPMPGRGCWPLLPPQTLQSLLQTSRRRPHHANEAEENDPDWQKSVWASSRSSQHNKDPHERRSTRGAGNEDEAASSPSCLCASHELVARRRNARIFLRPQRGIQSLLQPCHTSIRCTRSAHRQIFAPPSQSFFPSPSSVSS